MKLAPRFIGSYETDSVISPTAVRLKLPATFRIHPTFHVSQIKRFFFQQTVPPARVIDDHPTYTVQRILDVLLRGQSCRLCVSGGAEQVIGSIRWNLWSSCSTPVAHLPSSVTAFIRTSWSHRRHQIASLAS